MKRAVKTPKVYFLDTGLVSYLTKWKNKEVLETGNMAGSFFENFVIVEIIKSYYNVGEGGIICMYDKIMYLDDNNKVIPYRYL